MAEVAKSVVSEPEHEDVSLQELIETELALRAPSKSQLFSRDFITAEREASLPPLNGSAANGDEEWTTVEVVAKDIQEESETQVVGEAASHDRVKGGLLVETLVVDDEGPNSGNRSEGESLLVFEESSTVVTETMTELVDTVITTITEQTETVDVAEKKKKKKPVSENGTAEVSTVKTKKTKKKKTDEKENHISVMTNGHSSTPGSPGSPSSQIIEDDDLSNVCVKNLKLNYVNEATKSFTNGTAKPSEIPVAPPVSIRELRRSFGDIHKACETSEPTLEPPSDLHSRARSLGDLSRIERPRPIVTGVSVKELAAQYWRTVSIENNLDENCNKRIGKLDKSSFSKFDQLSKKSVLHVRSSDPAKASKTFSQGGADGQNPTCKACSKTVFAMEQIKAERAVWHKNCFRCNTCKKQLTVDIYSSHEGELYCKPHFKELFKPKAVIDQDEEPVRRRKPEMIIRENQPMELPPDVVRASDKPDLGLEELSSLNVKSRFQVFEKQDSVDGEQEKATVSVKRSSSILSKLAKFQKKGMDVGVTDEALNGFVYEESSTSEEESDEDEEEERGVVKCRRKLKERPMSFGKIDDFKKNWESAGDQASRREMMREQKKEELQNLRSRLFMGKQGKMKEMYEQAVAESEGKAPRRDSENDIVRSEKAKVVREKFEKGETAHSDDEEDGKNKKGVEEDMSVFEEGISKKSRSIFLEMDANAAKTQQMTPMVTSPVPKDKPKKAREVYLNRQLTDTEVVKSSDVVEDVIVETADVSSKFKFFETFKPTEKEKKAFRITPPREGQNKAQSPDREVYRDPTVVRCDEKEDESTILRSQTASKMLSLFKQMEEQKEVLPDGPKPKKCFTPPPDYRGSATEEEDSDEDLDDEEETDDSEGDDDVVKSSYKVKDEFLDQARSAARAKQLAAKFESWEPEKQSNNNAISMLESDHASIDSTKSLRAKFESLKSEQPKEKSRPKVNRFVEQSPTTLCASCDSKVYPLEKVETNGKIFHKQCFRCSYCNCILRMDSYTLNNGQLYCLPHFKQLFISKGNYDEGFGSNQHKRKWETPAN